ncbi:fatty acid desaturase [aff. Roholtiella sp. LEGE 12411]|uniref:fatty acid desaturase n=1 Tax=aff. Roholtiella sp. LEGE 12411 TaxID=1828822 RepID=UPI001882642B|nr:fatty acid desaturase [aff. Roholtiella sp. LEGE 12411]MBE9037977.1 fatty acid desaturase [aff. Roholtiella sp. LEGE 12411]
MSNDAIAQPKLLTHKPNQPSNPNQILCVEELSVLNDRSNWKGLVQLAGHLIVMGFSGYVWATNFGNWLLAIPALTTYGFSLAAMFAPMHECVHRTAFANHRLSEVVAWCSGLLSFYNSTFYRRYHKWHHRYTRIPDKDPELTDLKPSNLGKYLLVISGLPWWLGKISGHLRIALGQLEDYPFIPETARNEVIRSTRSQLAIYTSAIALSIAVAQPWFWLYWLLPLLVGQPILRFILLAEHTGCTLDANLLTNTRTTLTLWPVRFLMWNMPFHAEHHLYPSIPFYALPTAHQQLSSHFTHIEQGYMKVNWNIVAKSGQSASSQNL